MVDIINWENASVTAADNLAVAGISDAEGWLPSTVNNFTRASWAVLAKFFDEYGGVVTVAGTANAITVTSTGTHTALSTGLRLIFKAGSDNTTAATLNLDAIGAKAIRKISGGTDAALVAGDIKAGERYDILYDTTANAAAGAWILMAPSDRAPVASPAFTGSAATFTYTDDGTVGPTVDYVLQTSSPAANDVPLVLRARAPDSLGNMTTYAQIMGSILDPTDGSEDGQIFLRTIVGGVFTQIATIGANTVGFPAISFGSDTDTGFSGNGSNGILVSTNGAQVGIFNTNGLNIASTASPTFGVNAGLLFTLDGTIFATKSGNPAIQVSRTTNIGGVVDLYDDTTLAGSINVNGATAAYTSVSDETWKDDDGEIPLETAYEIVRLWTFHNFRWNDKAGPESAGKHDEGVFAQELHKVWPKPVTVGGWEKDDEGNDRYRPWSVDYSKLMVPVARAMQGVLGRLDALEAKN